MQAWKVPRFIRMCPPKLQRRRAWPIKKPMKKYSFNENIISELSDFKTYLLELGNSGNTICQKANYAGYFLKWLDSEYLKPDDTRYNDLLNFIDYCKLEGDSNKLINNKLRSITNYYEYLKKEDPNIINPATNLHLKGIRHKIPSDIIDFKDLENLYNSYKTNTLREKRNKVILGLLIYQGITTEELHHLEPVHIKLKQGKINIPGNRKRNSRTLELKPFQILELQEYINEVRPTILKQIGSPTSTSFAIRSLGAGRKPNKINHKATEKQLFISTNGSERLKASLLHLFKELPEAQNAKQIRASVIVNWLKNNNLRQVQYMAGHKYVSSTERYQLDNLEKLQDKLEKHHPLNTKAYE